MEKWAAKAGSNVSDSSFVAAFAQANVGDTSPNTQGAFCADTGKTTDFDGLQLITHYRSVEDEDNVGVLYTLREASVIYIKFEEVIL